MPSFILPDLGEGLTNARIVTWHVSVGEYVQCDAPLVTVETAKSSIEIPAPFSAYIEEILTPIDSTTNTGEALAILRSENEAMYHNPPKTLQVSTTTPPTSTVSYEDSVCRAVKNRPAMPAARNMAQQLGISLNNIQSSNEIITVQDVERHQQAIKTPIRSNNVCPTQLIANPSAIPATIHDHVNVRQWFQQTDTTARIIQSLVYALSQHAKINGHYSEEKPVLRPKKDIRIGLATQLPTGLFMPVMAPLNTQSNISDIRQQIDHCKTMCSAEKSVASNHTPSVIFSNIGTYAGMYSTPILMPPAVVIIATGKIREMATAENGCIVSAPILPISITFEHRALTGADVAAFLATFMSSLSHHHHEQNRPTSLNTE